jgi:hypothetical protein
MLELVHPTLVDDAGGASYTRAQARAMQRAVLRLFEHWSVSDADAAIILGGIAPRTVSRWRAGELGRVTRDLADRMSLLLGIHKSLRILFEEPGRGYRWIKAPNDAFGGRSALDILRQGGMADIARLRSYLVSVRAGW